MYSNGTSDLSLHFTSRDFDYALPDGAFLRVTRVNGVEGNFSQGNITQLSRSRTWNSEFSAAISFDRAFEKSEYMTVAICYADGSELSQLKLKLSRFTSADDTWPTPESIPPVPTLPPISPTPTPTPRPTLAPNVTEPPYESALYTVHFSSPDYHEGYTPKDCILRIYSDDLSVLTLRFAYDKELPEGTVARISYVGGIPGNYAEAVVTHQEDGTQQCVFFFNQAAGYMEYFSWNLVAPDDTVVFSHRCSLSRDIPPPDAWHKIPPLSPLIPAATATPTPLPAGVTPTPAPTVPPGSQELYKTRYKLLDPVKKFTLRNAVCRRYEGEFAAVTVSFLYKDELPEGAFLRLTHAEYAAGNFGEARIETDADGQHTATIVTDRLGESLRAFRVACCTAAGAELFYADFYATYGSALWDDSDTAWAARQMLPTATPVPSATPSPITDLSSATEPPYKTALIKCTYNLQGKVPKYSHYNTTYRQYTDFNTLNVFFFYKEELPKGAYMRVVSADGTAGDYGKAVIGPANVEGTDPSLLNAKIFSRTLPAAATLTLECCSPDGTVLFPLDFTIKDVSYPAGRENVPAVTPYRDPYGNSGSGSSVVCPFPTATPYKSWIEEGMYIQTPDPYGGGFFVVTPNPYSPGSSWYNGGSYWGW